MGEPTQREKAHSHGVAEEAQLVGDPNQPHGHRETGDDRAGPYEQTQRTKPMEPASTWAPAVMNPASTPARPPDTTKKARTGVAEANGMLMPISIHAVTRIASAGKTCS